MADIKESFKILMHLEFSSPYNALEQNATEHGLTFMGIYQVAHPDWAGWDLVMDALLRNNHSLANASYELYNNLDMQPLVYDFYKSTFWDVARLDEVSQTKANEIFIFGVNAGMRNAIKAAQKVLGFYDNEVDGIAGSHTIGELNKFSDEVFDKEYDQMEIAYYDMIIAKNPAKKIYARGWRNRALAV